MAWVIGFTAQAAEAIAVGLSIYGSLGAATWFRNAYTSGRHGGQAIGSERVNPLVSNPFADQVRDIDAFITSAHTRLKTVDRRTSLAARRRNPTLAYGEVAVGEVPSRWRIVNTGNMMAEQALTLAFSMAGGYAAGYFAGNLLGYWTRNAMVRDAVFSAIRSAVVLPPGELFEERSRRKKVLIGAAVVLTICGIIAGGFLATGATAAVATDVAATVTKFAAISAAAYLIRRKFFSKHPLAYKLQLGREVPGTHGAIDRPSALQVAAPVGGPAVPIVIVQHLSVSEYGRSFYFKNETTGDGHGQSQSVESNQRIVLAYVINAMKYRISTHFPPANSGRFDSVRRRLPWFLGGKKANDGQSTFPVLYGLRTVDVAPVSQPDAGRAMSSDARAQASNQGILVRWASPFYLVNLRARNGAGANDADRRKFLDLHGKFVEALAALARDVKTSAPHDIAQKKSTVQSNNADIVFTYAHRKYYAKEMHASILYNPHAQLDEMDKLYTDAFTEALLGDNTLV